MSSLKHSSMRLIGAWAPSSRFLADAMTRFVDQSNGSARILEVGAGTGAVTKSLIKKMRNSQTSDVVEIFPQLAKILNFRFKRHDEISIICGDILSVDMKDNFYDLVISSLPFNSLHPETTDAIFKRLVQVAKNGAIVSFFEYRSIQGLARRILSKERLIQFDASRAIIDNFIARYKFDETLVPINIPPAVVHYLRIDKNFAPGM